MVGFITTAGRCHAARRLRSHWRAACRGGWCRWTLLPATRFAAGGRIFIIRTIKQQHSLHPTRHGWLPPLGCVAWPPASASLSRARLSLCRRLENRGGDACTTRCLHRLLHQRVIPGGHLRPLDWRIADLRRQLGRQRGRGRRATTAVAGLGAWLPARHWRLHCTFGIACWLIGPASCSASSADFGCGGRCRHAPKSGQVWGYARPALLGLAVELLHQLRRFTACDALQQLEFVHDRGTSSQHSGS